MDESNMLQFQFSKKGKRCVTESFDAKHQNAINKAVLFLSFFFPGCLLSDKVCTTAVCFYECHFLEAREHINTSKSWATYFFEY